MRIISLNIKGINGADSIYDFSDKSANLVLSGSASMADLKKLLMLTFFGNSANITPDKDAAVICIFQMEERKFSIIREYNQDRWNAKLILLDSQEVLASDKDVDVVIPQLIKINAEVFGFLFGLDRAEISKGLTAESSERFGYLAVCIDKLGLNINNMSTIVQETQSEATELKIKIEMLTQAESNASGVSESDISDKNNMLKDLEKASEALKEEVILAKKYDETVAQIVDVEAKSRAHAAKQKDITALTNRLQVSDRVSSISNLYKQYAAIKLDVEGYKKDLVNYDDALQSLLQNIEKGEKSIKKQEQEYLYVSEKKKEYSVYMMDIIRKGATDFGTGEAMSQYYASQNADIEVLSAERDKLKAEYDIIIDKIKKAKTERDNIAVSYEYKKAVIEGAALELELKELDSKARQLAEKIDKATRLIESAGADKANTSNAVEELKRENAARYANIKGGYNNHQEAINAHIEYAEALYANHLLVGNLEVEAVTITDKIEKIEVANREYFIKISRLRAAKKQLEEHKEKLEIRLNALNDKILEIKAYNQSCNLAETLDFGDKCPICDSMVVKKKTIANKEISLVLEEVAKCKDAIRDTEQKALELVQSIGQYEATSTVSGQYLKSLKETKADKEAIISKILKECNVTSAAELSQKLQDAIYVNNSKINELEVYHQVEAEIAKKNQELNYLFDDIKEAKDVILPSSNKELEEILTMINQKLSTYGAMQPFLDSENATDLLAKLIVIERETSKYAKEIIDNEIKAELLGNKIKEIEAILVPLSSKSVPIILNNQQFTYKEIIEKTIADKLNAYVKEIDVLSAKEEEIKIKLSAVYKLVENFRYKKIETEIIVNQINTKIDTANAVADNIYASYSDEFELLGITNVQDLEKLTLPDDKKNKIKEIIETYNLEMCSYKEQLIMLEKEKQGLAAVKERVASNIQSLAELAGAAGELSKEIAHDVAIRNVERERKAKMIELKSRETTLNDRLYKINAMMQCVGGESILASELGAKIAEFAADKASELSNGRYTLSVTKDKVTLVNKTKGDREVSPDKATKEEQVLLDYVMIEAFTDAFNTLSGTDVMVAFELKADEGDRGVASLIKTVAAKDNVIIFVDDKMEKAIKKAN